MAKVIIDNRYYDSNSTKIITHPGPGNVKSVSINDGEKSYPDGEGNIDVQIHNVTEGLANDIIATADLGGVKKGDFFVEGSATENVLRKLLVPEVEPTIEIDLTPTEDVLYKTGTSVSMTVIKWTIEQGTAISLDRLYIRDASALVDIYTDIKSNKKTVSRSYTKNTTITATLYYTDGHGKNKSITATATYKFGGVCYVGVCAGEITESNIRVLKSELADNPNMDAVYNTTNTQRMIYIYPMSYKPLTDIRDENGLRLNTFMQNTMNIMFKGTACRLYYSDVVQLSGYKVSFKQEN